MWSWASAKWCLQASRKASIGTCSSLVSVDCWCLPRNRGERKNCCRCPSDNSHWWPQWVNLHWLTQYYLIISNQPGKSCRCGVISLRPELRLRSNQSRKMNGEKIEFVVILRKTSHISKQVGPPSYLQKSGPSLRVQHIVQCPRERQVNPKR